MSKYLDSFIHLASATITATSTITTRTTTNKSTTSPVLGKTFRSVLDIWLDYKKKKKKIIVQHK